MKKVRMIFVLLVILLLISTIAGCSQNLDNSSSNENNKDSSTTTPLPVLYEKDKTINAFLNCYNTANYTAPIDMNDFSPYYHHGREHEDQIRGWIGNVEIVISKSYTGKDMEIKVVLDGNTNSANEEYETLFKLFANAFYQGAPSETLNDNWNNLLNGSMNSIENDYFECDMTIYDNKIEMIVIEG